MRLRDAVDVAVIVAEFAICAVLLRLAWRDGTVRVLKNQAKAAARVTGNCIKNLGFPLSST